ncbi:MAG: hypothetical protein JWP89_5618 [Schlesneria sp.]|nr:hypothetical protein [Schlesneria sp.]
MFSVVRRYCLLGFIVMGVGCETRPKANYDRLNLVKAGGTITLDGQPLAGAVVSFDDPTDGTFSYGLTNSSGYFKLQIDSVMAGVKPGAKLVRVSTTRKILGLNTKEEGAGGSAKSEHPVEVVPPKYNKKSTLQVEVTSGKTDYDFDLKSE